MSLLVYLGGGALLGGLVRWWRPRLGWGWIAGYWLLAGAWFAAPLITGAVQGPLDVAYESRPWREMVETPAAAANGLLLDVPLQLLPFHALARERLLRFEAPLWANEMGTGQPLLANAQSAPFSPLGLLVLPLSPVAALPVAAALKLLLSLLLTDALLAALGAGRAGACFAAIAFTFSVYSICWAFYPLGVAAAWLPGVLLGLVLLRRGERGGLAGLTACATGMALAGHPETLAHTALAAGAVAAALLLRRYGGEVAAHHAHQEARPAQGDAAGVGANPGQTSAGSRHLAGNGHAGGGSTPGGGRSTPEGGGSGGGGLRARIRPLDTGTAAGPSRWRFLAGLAAAAAMTAGLAAPALLPVVEGIPDTVRGQLLARTVKGVQPLPFTTAALNLALDPLAQGSPRDRDWTGPSNFNERCSGYAGLLALALAVAAALTLGGRALAIFSGGAAAMAAALAIPPFLGAVRALPLLDHAANGRLRLLWVLALAVAAGLGLEPLAARRSGRWVAAACCAAAACGLALEHWPAAPWQRAWWLATAGSCALCAAAFAWAAARPSGNQKARAAREAKGAMREAGGAMWEADGATQQANGANREANGLKREADGAPRWPRRAGLPRALPWLAVACLALDLSLLNGRFLPVLPARFDLAPPPAVAVMTAAMGAAAGPAASGPGAGGPFRVIGQGDALQPNLAALYGLWDPRSNDPMQPARATQVVGRAFRERYRIGDPMPLTTRPLPVPFLSYLGVRFILTRHRERLFPPWEEAWDGTGGKLWRNPEALPLFFMPATWRPARDPDEALLATLANQDFAASAVAETGGGAAPLAGAAAEPRRQAGQVRIRRVLANSFELEVGAPAGGLVVSSVTSCGGWHLAVDGRPATLLRVNAGFLGFMTPAGWHRAALVYRPAGWTWGLRLCGLTALALLAVAVFRAGRGATRRAAR
ncbi:MAG TPA: hypothetical protein VKY89_07315 [Thermoanaerobaculia bacterium]|nr:hypothetical protein [Thermoanaerobaculia bacterium]